MHKKLVRLLSRIIGLVVMALAVFYLSMALAQQAPQHPLDELKEAEVKTVVATLKATGMVNKASRFATIVLNPPPKAEVWNWKPGNPIPSREAFVVVKQGRQVFEGVVNLLSPKVESWQEVKAEGQPVILDSEYELADELLRADPLWQAAMRKRGITNFEDVVCTPLSGTSPLGYSANQRLLTLPCALETGDKNFWGHPIEGVQGLVDLDAQKVVEVIDAEVVPVPQQPAGFGLASVMKQVGRLRKAPLPYRIEQPNGPTFTVNGRLVNWQNWQFHFRIDPRVGPVIGPVTYKDKGQVRKVMYEGSLGEVLVHYADPSPIWYDRNFLDAGDFNMGRLAVPLQPARDCPMNAKFFSAVFVDEKGEPYTQENVACLFEERGEGGLEWRHYEEWHETTESRSRRNLVLRFIAAIGNYDYIIDWSFQQNGMIKVAIGASGTEEVKVVKSQTLADDSHKQDTQYGTLIDAHLVGITHQHIYNFRLDLDVDGMQNSSLETVPKIVRAENSPKGSAIIVENRPFRKELEARRPYDVMAYWQVINPNAKNRNGYPVGYALQPRWNTQPLLLLEDLPSQRFGYLNYHLWVTPYQPREFYPTGDYPVSSQDRDGLLRWTQANRRIENTDIVLWYTTGNTHVVRPEEWPVLPVEWVSFELKPFNFFDRTPSLDLPGYH